MSTITYFPEFGADDEIANVHGSSFGEPDSTIHRIEVLEGEGHLVLRVQLQGSQDAVDLLFENEQAIAFGAGVQAVLRRLGLD